MNRCIGCNLLAICHNYMNIFEGSNCWICVINGVLESIIDAGKLFLLSFILYLTLMIIVYDEASRQSLLFQLILYQWRISLEQANKEKSFKIILLSIVIITARRSGHFLFKSYTACCKFKNCTACCSLSYFIHFHISILGGLIFCSDSKQVSLGQL